MGGTRRLFSFSYSLTTPHMSVGGSLFAYRSNDTSVVAVNEGANGGDGAAFSFSYSFTTPHMSVGGSLFEYRSNDTSVVAVNEEVNGSDGAAFSFSYSFSTPHMWGASYWPQGVAVRASASDGLLIDGCGFLIADVVQEEA